MAGPSQRGADRIYSEENKLALWVLQQTPNECIDCQITLSSLRDGDSDLLTCDNHSIADGIFQLSDLQHCNA